jgi:hypothetical protein
MLLQPFGEVVVGLSNINDAALRIAQQIDTGLGGDEVDVLVSKLERSF